MALRRSGSVGPRPVIWPENAKPDPTVNRVTPVAMRPVASATRSGSPDIMSLTYRFRDASRPGPKASKGFAR